MVRIIRILSWLALGGAAMLLVLCVRHHKSADLSDMNRVDASVAEQFEQADAYDRKNLRESVFPLVRQAQIFAAYLNPPPPPERKNSPHPEGEAEKVAAQAPAIRPPSTSAKFKLRGISYRPSRPRESMALIWEADSGHRWVKEGTQLGYTTIVEISASEITYRMAEQVYTMLVDAEDGASHVGPDHGKTLALKKKGRSSTDRTVAANTVLPSRTHNRRLRNSEENIARTERPPMQRYRLGR